ncbi:MULTISPECIES: hypothetical protein [Pseudoalteromonas]|uniref:Uncharacterized protein n=1 Tax=Pseudoalteromonas fuliginea TaxID=1872678 RepID=A0ABQ6RHY4_9GAMM|nr:MULTISPECIES: hypothetical protein [Pseudoalteromonas]KAA1156126.1 hypothetical protein EU509_10055 [Pseudoalteromonas fuliginea]KAA1167315.1 hypothetical protein EUZ79_10045 [Pseudoalteromonas fuliginea]
MKKLVLILALFSANVSAWVQSGNTTIKEFVQWEARDGSGYALLILENDILCHIPLKEKELYSLALSLYMSKKTFNVHCHDAVVNLGGYNSHKIHRLNAVQ